LRQQMDPGDQAELEDELLRMLDREEEEDADLNGPDDDEEAMMRGMENEEEEMMRGLRDTGSEEPDDAGDEELLLSLREGYNEGPDDDEEAMMRDMERDDDEPRPEPRVVDPVLPPQPRARVAVPPAVRVLTRNIVYQEALG